MSPADEEIVEALKKELSYAKKLAEKYRCLAVTGWESARSLAIAGLHRATEKAADEVLAKLRGGT